MPDYPPAHLLARRRVLDHVPIKENRPGVVALIHVTVGENSEHLRRARGIDPHERDACLVEAVSMLFQGHMPLRDARKKVVGSASDGSLQWADVVVGESWCSPLEAGPCRVKSKRASVNAGTHR